VRAASRYSWNNIEDAPLAIIRASTEEPETSPALRAMAYGVAGVHVTVIVDVASTFPASRPTVPKDRLVAAIVQSLCTVAVTLNFAVLVAAGASADGSTRIAATSTKVLRGNTRMLGSLYARLENYTRTECRDMGRWAQRETLYISIEFTIIYIMRSTTFPADADRGPAAQG